MGQEMSDAPGLVDEVVGGVELLAYIARHGMKAREKGLERHVAHQPVGMDPQEQAQAFAPGHLERRGGALVDPQQLFAHEHAGQLRLHQGRNALRAHIAHDQLIRVDMDLLVLQQILQGPGAAHHHGFTGPVMFSEIIRDEIGPLRTEMNGGVQQRLLDAFKPGRARTIVRCCRFFYCTYLHSNPP